ncbi:cobalt-zinc-cadmium efflux system outer membrane protein [Salinibacter ruber]|uniref:Cobalt-zinc-cadmium efflux system outer membrane protein n=1 Tax=Salinibacter ruber TaxID=146919 RepID=A0A9X2TF91_9BACT|nr:TolC family protein [Salinibacter ruber]MCS3676261.1 cobalt-zinc-cadmium efflux system outer membrane protein [Salinibacter ruber]MCS3679548.1 cobalt-zinc-cadmium efflux system outer membrane protein [Salinibacter ruber]
MSAIPFRCVLLVAILSVLGGTADAQPARVQAERSASPAARQAPGLDRHAPEAGSADSLRTVSLREALRFFRENNLSLRRAQSAARALEGEARQVKAYPNPTLQATHEPHWRGDTHQSETYLNLSQKLEWSGRQARIASAEKTAAAARARASADSARLALQVTEAYVEAATAETRRRRLEQVTRVFRQADSSMAERRNEGDASGYAVRRIQLERARYEQRLAAARLDARSARRQLALLILPDEAPPVAAEPLPGATPPSISRGEAVRTALRARPELRRWQSAVAAQEAARRAARQEAWPDPSITAGYKRQSDGFEGAFLGIGLPLPFFDRNRGAAEAESARLRAAQTQQALARREIRNEVRRARAAYASTRRQSQLLEGDLLRGSGDLLRIAQTSYDEGEMSLVELLDAADAYRDARIRSVNLRADLWTRYFSLLRAMGQPIDLP